MSTKKPWGAYEARCTEIIKELVDGHSLSFVVVGNLYTEVEFPERMRVALGDYATGAYEMLKRIAPHTCGLREAYVLHDALVLGEVSRERRAPLVKAWKLKAPALDFAAQAAQRKERRKRV